MLNIIIFGAPGSGKGTQSEYLVDAYHLFHISTGDVLRDHIKRGTELGRTAKEYIDQGQLIPDDLMIEILGNVLDEHCVECADGVIFDGFPRTIAQAEALQTMLAERGTQVGAVIGLEVPEEELVKRILLRGQRSGRADDTESTARKRLEVYHKQTAPLQDYYRRLGLYHGINGHGEIADILGRIRHELDPLAV